MATKITLGFGDFVFSSAVERITVQTAASAVDISLHILDGTGETLVFSETYYPYSGTVALHDFASVIEAEMVLCEQPLARFRITAQSTDGTSTRAPSPFSTATATPTFSHTRLYHSNSSPRAAS